MTDFSGVNQFGSITTQNGYKLSFKDLDVNGDGEVTESEFKSVMETVETDSVELSTGNTTEEEQTLTDEQVLDYEIDAGIQQSLNDLMGQISVDFTGTNADLGNEMIAALKEFAETFKAEYTGDVSLMLEEFKAQLPEKYEELKAELLPDDQSSIKSEVLESVLANIQGSSSISSLTADTAKSVIQTLGKKLETLADKFISNYTGDNLEEDLTNYLTSKLSASDAEKMSDAVNKYRNIYNNLGVYVDSGEFNTLKDSVREFFGEALSNGLTLRMNGVNVASEAAIETLLKKYTDAESLNADMEALIDSLSTDTMLQSVVAEKQAEQTQKAESAFQNLTGEDVKVDTSLSGIDYSQIPGYYENATIKSRRRGAKGLAQAQDEARNLLETTLKDQLKTQLTEKLEAKGVPFEKMETVFETAFNQACSNAVGNCVNPRSNFFFNFSKSTYNVQDLVNTFTTQFNEIISTTIDEMNASNTDMDIQDIDYTQAITDDNGNVNPLLQDALETGTTLATRVSRRNADQYEELANDMINKLKSTMLAKSMAMCEANGIEFDNEAFNNVFSNAQTIAVTGSTSETNIGWFGLRRTITFNPQNCLNTFTETFQSNYTSWIESEEQKV